MNPIPIIENLIVAVTLILVFLTVYNLHFGLMGYTLMYFTRIGELSPFLGSIHFERIAAIFILALMFLRKKEQEGTFTVIANPVVIAFAGFLGVMLLSIPFGVSPRHAYLWFTDFLKLGAFCLMIVTLVDSAERLRSFIWLYLACIGWLAFVPCWKYLHGEWYVAQGIQRISAGTSFFSNPNFLANVLSQTIPFSFYLSLSEEKWRNRILLGLLCLLFLATIVMTGSRGGFLGLVTVLFVLWLKSKHRIRNLLLAVGFFVSIWTLMGDKYRERQLSTLELGRSDRSAQTRIDGLKIGFTLLTKYPIFGVGTGCFQNARKHLIDGAFIWAHNHYGQLMGDLGLSGVISWTAFIYLIFRNISRTKRLLEAMHRRKHWIYHVCNAMQVSLIGRLVMGLTTHSLYSFIWYITGALSVLTLHFVQGQALEYREVSSPDAPVWPNSYSYHLSPVDA